MYNYCATIIQIRYIKEILNKIILSLPVFVFLAQKK